MVILSVDPSLTSTGYAVFDEKNLVACGKIKTNNKDLYTDRLKEIGQKLSYLIKKFGPKIMAIETQYLTGIRTNSILKVSEVKGVCVGIFFEIEPAGIVREVAPTEMKSAIGMPKGKRKEYKKWSKEYVAKMFPSYQKLNDDVCDAICIGLTTIMRLNK